MKVVRLTIVLAIASLSAVLVPASDAAYSSPKPLAEWWSDDATQSQWHAPNDVAAPSSAGHGWHRALPRERTIETVLKLPDRGRLRQGVEASLMVGRGPGPGEHLAITATFDGDGLTATISSPGHDTGLLTATAKSKTGAVRAVALPGRLVTVGVAMGELTSRLLINGSLVAEIPAAAPADRCVSASTSGCELRGVRALPGRRPGLGVSPEAAWLC